MDEIEAGDQVSWVVEAESGTGIVALRMVLDGGEVIYDVRNAGSDALIEVRPQQPSHELTLIKRRADI